MQSACRPARCHNSRQTYSRNGTCGFPGILLGPPLAWVREPAKVTVEFSRLKSLISQCDSGVT